jgi:hypothetical protein
MKGVFLTLFAVICLTAFANTALACACCVEEGTYIIWTGAPGESERAMLDSMEFDKKAKLYMTEAGFDTIKGLEDFRNDYESDEFMSWDGSFDLVNEFTNKTWKFTVRSPSGKTGTLVLPMPTQMVWYKADIHDTKDTGLGVQLYKEMRFKGSVQGGTGVFRSSIIKPTTYFLVFQGRGNGCDDYSNFTHWHLEINGKKASYEFNGRLNSGAVEQTEETKNQK